MIAPLERLWPVEPLRDRHAVGIDVLYTLIHRLGLFKLIMFFSVEGWLTSGIGWLRAHGLPHLCFFGRGAGAPICSHAQVEKNDGRAKLGPCPLMALPKDRKSVV